MTNGIAEVIDLIYDASYDDAAFQRLPGALSGLTGGRSSTVQLLDGAGVHTDFAMDYYSADMVAQYAQHFYAQDVWIHAGRRRKGQCLSMDDLVDYETLKMTSLYNDFFRAHGDDTAHCLGVAVDLEEGLLIVGIQRAHNPGQFTPAETARLQRVVPHLKRLHALRARLRTAEARANVATAALDRLADAVMVVRPDRRIVLSNAAADALLNEKCGLTVKRGCLRAVNSEDDRRLELALFHAGIRVPHSVDAFQLSAVDESAALRLVAAPMPDRRGVLVMIDLPDRSRNGAEALAKMYNLSAAETALALALLRGDRPEDVAEARGVRISTVRTQLSSLLSKTGTQRQGQLLTLLAAMPTISPK